MSYSKAIVALGALALAACGTMQGRNVGVATRADAGPPVVIYVIKRSWHTDIGFDASDLHLPLAGLRAALPGAHYLLFGFGDQHYLMDRGSRVGSLVGALWPGPGLVLVTALAATPEEAFGDAGVIRLTLNTSQARELEGFVWDTLASTRGEANFLAEGPYEGSLYYASTLRYSGLHTCNTWTAEGLHAAGLPIRTFAVYLSGQLWRQVKRVERQQNAADRESPLQAYPYGGALQSGTPP